MSQFYCREDELRKLNKRYAGDKFECIVIYGRRRVGKTALINEFCKDNTYFLFCIEHDRKGKSGSSLKVDYEL